MNFFEQLAEQIVGYSIDWDATGTWLGAAVTAGAVFIAAGLGERSAKIAEEQRRMAELKTLMALYDEAQRIIGEIRDDTQNRSHEFISSRPSSELLQDMADALAAIPILHLNDAQVVESLMHARRAIVDAQELVRDLQRGDHVLPSVRERASTLHSLLNASKGRLGATMRRTSGWKPKMQLGWHWQKFNPLGR